MNILIFHTGSLGDTLIAVPALWAIREYFSHDRIVMLCEKQMGKKYVQVQDILDGSGIIDEYLFYPVYRSFMGKIFFPLQMIRLLVTLRGRRFDRFVYLIRAINKEPRVFRDLFFFRLAGIRHVIGDKGFTALPEKILGKPLPSLSHMADLFLMRLAASGIPVPQPGKGRMDVNIGKTELETVKKYLLNLSNDGRQRCVGIGPGSKMSAKVWPMERFVALGKLLIQSFDIWPVILGGSEDMALGEMLVKEWGRGYVAAGVLNIRQSIVLLQSCTIFIGNDTGTLHMAVSAGVRCVGIYSARDYPNLWYPYGTGHIILRTYVPCEGCMLETCIEQKKKCILAVSVEDVFYACQKLLKEK